MGDHRRQVESLGDEVEVMLERVLAHATDLFDPERVLEPMTRSSLKYKGVHSKRFGVSTPLTTSVPPVARMRNDVSMVSGLPMVS